MCLEMIDSDLTRIYTAVTITQESGLKLLLEQRL